MLRVQKFTFNPFQENTYIIYNDKRNALIVDPGCSDSRECTTLSAFISEKDLKVRRLLNTHCHIDHVFGNRFVYETFGTLPEIPKGETIVLESVVQVAKLYGLSYEESPKPSILSSDRISLDSDTLSILSVPGHSPDHVAFYSEKDGFVVSGDALFRESIGRTDLPGGDMNTLLASIKNNMFCLPQATVVYSGHMENTTIGHEKEHNPFLR